MDNPNRFILQQIELFSSTEVDREEIIRQAKEAANKFQSTCIYAEETLALARLVESIPSKNETQTIKMCPEEIVNKLKYLRDLMVASGWTVFIKDIDDLFSLCRSLVEPKVTWVFPTKLLLELRTLRDLCEETQLDGFVRYIDEILPHCHPIREVTVEELCGVKFCWGKPTEDEAKGIIKALNHAEIYPMVKQK